MGSQKPDGYFFRIVILIGALLLSISIGWKSLIDQQEGLPLPLSQGGPISQPQILDNQMAIIPAGDFLMGSDEGRSDEQPLHTVYLDEFYIDRYEITNLQYQHFVIDTRVTPPRYWSGDLYPPGLDHYPVVGVRWKDAQAFCAWAGKRLPSEAEWEKTCRGPQGLTYPWGNHPGNGEANVGVLPGGPNPEMWDQAWEMLASPADGSGKPGLMPVGSFPEGASPYQVYDLVGNASEWTADHYNWDGYWNTSTQNPLVSQPPWNHVVRGSSWWMPYGISPAGIDLNRCSSRSSSHGDTRDARIGFRCAWSDLD